MDDLGKKAKDGLLHGLQFLKGKAKETMDLQKLHTQQKSLEHRREECYIEVGRMVFVFFEMDKVQNLTESDWEQIRPRIDEVKDINRKLHEVEEQVAALRAGGHHEEEAPPAHSEHEAPP